MKKTDDAVPVRPRGASKKPAGRDRNKPAPVVKQRIKVDYSGMEVSEYYLKASVRYRAAKYIAFFMLIVFLAVNLLFFRSNITYSNLMYLLRDLDTGVAAPAGEFASISYNEESAASYGIFKGRLAVASSSGFRLYNSTGARELDESGYFLEPAMVSGDKYAIAYDVGGHGYRVFTTMACVLSATEEEIIEDVCVSDSGDYAVMTRSDESKYLISVYKENFRLQTKYYKDKYPCDMALDKKGDNLAVVSADVTVSGIGTEIMLCKPGTEEKQTLTVSGAMPLACTYTDSGNLLVLCDDRVVTVKDGAVESTYELKGGSVSDFRLGDDTIAVACGANAANSKSKLYLFDGEGSLVFEKSISEKIRGICSDTGALYVLCEDKIVMLSADEKKTAEADASTENILALYGGLLKCEKLGTSPVSFE